MKYIKTVVWSDEDGCYIGSAPPLIGQCCQSNTEEAALEQLDLIIEEWLEILKTNSPKEHP